jgi:very-short-patch-repair endonuclease
VSPPERTLAAALRAAGLTEIRAGVTVVAGGRQFWLDFAEPHRRLAIEVDGVRAHTDPAVFAADRTRQNLLIRDGWTVLRYTPWQIREDLPGVVAEICSTLLVSG